MRNFISRTSAVALVVSVAGAGYAQQTFSFAGPIDSIPETGTPVQFLAQNPVTTPYLVGANVNLISGDLTAVNTETWASEARIRLTNSAFPALTLIVQPFTSQEITGTISVTPGSIAATGGLAGTGTLVPAASTWNALFYDSFDDGADTLVDSQWTGTVSFSTTVGTIPPPSPYIYDNLLTAGTTYLNQRTFGLGTAGVGDFLTLAGTNRSVTRVDAVYFASTTGGAATRADFTVKLWTGVGPFVSATPLATYSYNDVPLTGGALNTLGFGGMSADLGAGALAMGYTITLSDIQGGTGGLGPVIFNPPVIGSSSAIWLSDYDNVLLATSPNILAYAFAAPNPNNFGARVWAASAATISGNMVLQNTADDGAAGTESITWTLSNGVDTYTGTVDVNDFGGGAYSFPVPSAAPNGAYTLRFKGGTFLASLYNVTLTGSSITQAVSLRNGNIDQDSEVGPGDFEAVVAQFGNPGDADCDNDGEVGPSDFEIVNANFSLEDE